MKKTIFAGIMTCAICALALFTSCSGNEKEIPCHGKIFSALNVDGGTCLNKVLEINVEQAKLSYEADAEQLIMPVELIVTDSIPELKDVKPENIKFTQSGNLSVWVLGNNDSQTCALSVLPEEYPALKEALVKGKGTTVTLRFVSPSNSVWAKDTYDKVQAFKANTTLAFEVK